MPSMDLFLATPQLEFEKAASTSLDEDSMSWTRQILAELHRSCPAIAEYMATVTFLKRDDQQGYALAMVVLENGIDSALSATRVGGSKPGRAVVPAIVKNYELLPLDVFMSADGRALPLTADRLREALFNPAVGEALTSDFGDTSLYNLFYPLGRAWGADYGGGLGSGLGNNATTAYGPGMKYAAAAPPEGYSLLGEIASTLLAPDVHRALASFTDPAVKLAAVSNDNMVSAMELLAEAADSAVTSAEPLYKAAESLTEADVAQFGYDTERGTYWMKTASSRAYVPRDAVQLDRGQMLKIAGEEVTRKVDVDGTVTVSSPRVVEQQIDLGSHWKIIDAPGIYKVRGVDGAELMGWVIPNLIDLDGTRLPAAVFTNGSSAMMQDQIVGARIATGVDLPADEVKGVGVFYTASASGIVATVPVTIVGGERGRTGKSWEAMSMTGENAHVHLVPGLKTIDVDSKNNTLFLPDTARFIKLDAQPVRALVSEIAGLEKTASDEEEPRATIRSTGSGYALSFEHAPKLAGAFTGDLSTDEAAFALAVGGLEAIRVMDKLAEADARGFSRVGVQDMTMFSELVRDARAKTASFAGAITALKTNLVKEASAMPSAMTVDAVLSLGFLNPENVRLFMGRLPYLEKALSMTCEMVVASRLGLSSIPEGAAGRAARALDSVINGLRGLALLDMSQA